MPQTWLQRKPTSINRAALADPPQVPLPGGPHAPHHPRAARTQLTCKNWLIGAADRMVQNNLDPEVAFDPEHLIVYGGRGKAARNW